MPYRPLFVERPRERGGCPWCRAAIELDLSAASGVCSTCNARFANAFARTPPSTPPPVAPEQSLIARTYITIGAVIRVLVIAVLTIFVRIGFALVTPRYGLLPPEKPLHPTRRWRI